MAKLKTVLMSAGSAGWIVVRTSAVAGAAGTLVNWLVLAVFLRHVLSLTVQSASVAVAIVIGGLALGVGFPILYVLLGKAYGTRAAVAHLYETHRDVMLRALQESVNASPSVRTEPLAELPRSVTWATRLVLKAKGLPDFTVDRLREAEGRGAGANIVAAAEIIDGWLQEEFFEPNPWWMILLAVLNLVFVAAIFTFG